jgi:hypothetical protein
MKARIAAVALAMVLIRAPEASAGLILGNFIGGVELGSRVGGGNIVDIFNSAASTWSHALMDDFEVTIDYGWGPDPGGYHFLGAQGGTPNRETAGLILVNPQIFGPGDFVTLFMDPTPDLNEEFLPETRYEGDLGGGIVTTGRVFQASSDAPTGLWQDLYTMILHEIGHALGLSNANTSFQSEAVDGQITIGDQLPFGGTILPLATNNFGVTSHLDPTLGHPVMSGLGFNDRRLPSAIDVLVNAQLSGFQNVNLSPLQLAPEDPAPTPEPATLLLTVTGLTVIFGIRRKKRREY